MQTPSPAAKPVRPPSPWWKYFVVGLFVSAIAVASTAWFIAEEAQKPIGEGALFVDDMESGLRIIETSDDPAELTVRRIRNDLEVEAVSLVGADGIVDASTSSTLVGTPLENPILVRSLGRSDDGNVRPPVIAAVAETLDVPVELDGVEMWSPGEALYHVSQPLDGGGALLVSYDVSELLARRSLGREVPQRTFDLFLLSGILAVTGVIAMTARSRTVRAFDVFDAESRLLREHADSLEMHNMQLDAARRSAERALELAEEKNRIRSEFVLMINHELRTPLTGVVSGAELALDLAGDETTRSLLEDVVVGAKRLEEMIGEMLVVARVENRGLFVTLEPTQVDEIVERIVDLSPRCAVAVDPDVDLDRRLLTDATTLPRLVSSLAANSFTHGATQVAVRCVRKLPFAPSLEVGERPEECLFFVVADNGPGIDREFLPRAFEKFEKQSFSSGTGLGLYLARMMVEALGGSITVITGKRGTAMAVGVPLENEMASL